ncbi:MAG TPA: hypothetical protein VFZ27_07105 [Terriglobia bacterium]|nr:hypothetical protein [Terriglobia bacterium]
MRLIALGCMTLFSSLVLPSLGLSQYGYVPECQQAVATQLNISRLDVSAQLGPYTANRNRIVNWSTRRGRDNSGYCEFNTATGELVRAASGQYNGNSGYHSRFGSGAGNPGQPNQRSSVDYPSVNVNTSGQGGFKGAGNSVRITRGWVDTSGQQVTVSLSGEHDFRINFYGRIRQQSGDREYVMQIERSDRGPASGRAIFRLNDDRNEVESISVAGRLNGQNINGNFRR